MRKKVVYHGNCVDGFTAMLAAKMKLQDSADYIPGFYGEDLPTTMFIGADVYLVDFSWKRKYMEEVLNLAKSVTILDHHKTAFDDLKDLKHEKFTKVLDNNKSGAVLSWEHFHPGTEVPKLLKMVQDRDLWKWELDDTKAVYLYLVSLDWDEKKYMNAILEPSTAVFAGKCLEKYHDSICEDQASMYSYTKAFNWHKEYGDIPLVIDCPKSILSDVLHILAEDHLFSACVNRGKNGVFNWSLRASDKNDFDVSEVAKKHGGGGHAKAAGFEIKG